MGLTYPFKANLVLLSRFEIDFAHKILHIQCKNCSIKVLKLKSPKNLEITLNFNCIFSNHEVMLQLLGFEHPYVLYTCFYLTKVFGTDLTNSTPTFSNAQSFGPFHQRLQIYPSGYLITKKSCPNKNQQNII
jgi:hypothetical protein